MLKMRYSFIGWCIVYVCCYIVEYGNVCVENWIVLFWLNVMLSCKYVILLIEIMIEGEIEKW